MWCSSEGGEGTHHCVVQHTLPFMYLCLLPEDGRMERHKLVVVEATKLTCCVHMSCLCGFTSLLKGVLDLLRNRFWIHSFRSFCSICVQFDVRYLQILCLSPFILSADFVSVALYIICRFYVCRPLYYLQILCLSSFILSADFCLSPFILSADFVSLPLYYLQILCLSPFVLSADFVSVALYIICRFCLSSFILSADFVSVALYIIVPSKDHRLMSSSQCQSPVFLVCWPADTFCTKLQANHSKSCA